MTVDNRHYDLLIMFSPDVEENVVKQQVEKYLKLVSENDGEFTVDFWGRRELAYEIQKHSEGIYVSVDMHVASDIAKELERQLSLNEDILRIKILRIDDK